MKALIHIGLPKVGSSSIQEFLKVNRAALQARGIRYAPYNDAFGSQFELAATGVVNAGAEIADEHSRITLCLRSAADERAYVERYRAFLDDALPTWSEELFVGSSEHIQPWFQQPAMIEALDDFLSQRFSSVRYVVYLRPQVDILTSSYSERIRRGERPDFEQHLTVRTKALNFNALVRRWENVVTADRLDVRLMTDDALVGGTLISDFCAAMGTTRDGLTEPARMNTALSRQDIQLRKRLNAWLPVRRKRDGNYNPTYFTAHRYMQRLQWLFQGRDDAPLTLSPDQRALVESQVARTNEALRKRRFPHRPTLF